MARRKIIVTDGNRLVNQILSEIKQKMNAAFHEQVYRDEAIPVPSKVVHRVAGAMTDNIPAQIREMKLLVNHSNTWHYSEAELFYRQALLMQDYEDDYQYYGEFYQNLPSYRTMSVSQLRGYFTWRTKLRHGQFEHPQLSYALLYAYELLNQIGVENPEQGLFMLKNFWTAYQMSDSRLDCYMRTWLCDYAVYYNLDASLLEGLMEPAFDSALQVLLNHREQQQDELFHAICALSGYNLPGSAFYHAYPEDTKNVVCAVFDSLSAYYEKNRKKSLCEKLFGVIAECEYEMFYSAIFFDQKRYDNYVYSFNDIHSYRCSGGKWHCRKFYGNRSESKELGSILRLLDSRMREKYGFKSALQAEPLTKTAADIIEKAIDRRLAENRKNAAPKIEIDLSKLSGIRESAELTRERLLAVDVSEASEEPLRKGEEKAETAYITEPVNRAEAPAADSDNRPGSASQTAAFVADPGIRPGSASQTAAFAADSDIRPGSASQTAVFSATAAAAGPHIGPQDTAAPDAALAGLTDIQYHFLHHLLRGEDYRSLLRENRVMLSVIVEAINEALYEQFADNIIEFDGETPALIKDYEEELNALCGLQNG